MKKLLLLMVCMITLLSCNETEKQQPKQEVKEVAKSEAKSVKTETVEKDSDLDTKSEEKIHYEPLAPNINKIKFGSEELGFTHTEDLTKEKLLNDFPEIEINELTFGMNMLKCKKGEGMMDTDDFHFEDMEKAVATNSELPVYSFSSHTKLIEKNKFKLLEFITLSAYDSTDIRFAITLCTTTPTEKIIITIYVFEVSDAMPNEVPDFFQIPGSMGVTQWNWEKHPNVLEDFARSLVEGNCQSKTAQKAYEGIQEIIKTIEIE